jgi:antitoxin CptB
MTAETMDCQIKPGNDDVVDNSRNTGADIGRFDGYITPARHVRAFGVGLDVLMTGMTRSSGGLDIRRKRLLFRCWHRGTREMDLILGRFADAEIATLADAELDELERLIEVPDPDLYAAVIGDKPPGPDFNGALFARIRAFRPADDLT